MGPRGWGESMGATPALSWAQRGERDGQRYEREKGDSERCGQGNRDRGIK